MPLVMPVRRAAMMTAITNAIMCLRPWARLRRGRAARKGRTECLAGPTRSIRRSRSWRKCHIPAPQFLLIPAFQPVPDRIAGTGTLARRTVREWDNIQET